MDTKLDTDQGQDPVVELLPVVVPAELFVNRSDVGYALTKLYLELAETAATDAQTVLNRTLADATTPDDLLTGLTQTQRDLDRAIRIAQKAKANFNLK